MTLFIIIGVALLLVLLSVVGILSRYRKCPSDQILVIFGKTGGGKSAKCIHGGAAFVIPIVQGYSFMSLKPLQFECNLQKALSSQNIRVDVPTTVTVGISTEPEVMQMAAERLLGLSNDQIEDLVKDIVYGQMRLIVSNMTIEELNSERDKFLEEVKNVVGGELRKIGLHLINVNITDIRDEAGYIVALGQKDKAIALNKANVEIAKAEKDGATQTAEQNKIKNSEVAATQREEAIAVAEANAERDSKVAETQRTRDINVATAKAEGEIGKIEAEKTVTNKNAELEVVRADAEKAANTARVKADAEVAKEKELAQVEVVKAEAKVLQEQELAQKTAEEARAQRQEAALRADKIVPAEISKRESLLRAEAYQLEQEKIAETNANKTKIEADGKAQAEALKGEGEAKAITAKGLAEAEVVRQRGLAQAEAEKASLKAQADGFREMIEAAKTDPTIAIQFKMVQEGTYENIAREQVEAYKHMNFGNVTIMDTTKGGGLTNVMQSLLSQVSPILNVMKSMELPGVSKALEEKTEDAKFPEVK